jgi:hypothetical protein
LVKDTSSKDVVLLAAHKAVNYIKGKKIIIPIISSKKNHKSNCIPQPLSYSKNTELVLESRCALLLPGKPWLIGW